jgi:hypothetical protein
MKNHLKIFIFTGEIFMGYTLFMVYKIPYLWYFTVRQSIAILQQV